MDESDSDEPSGCETGRAADLTISEADLLRAVIDLIPALIYAKDVHSRFIVCNQFTARAMGTTPAEAIGRTDFDFYPEEMARRFLADEQQVLASGEPVIDREESALDRETGNTRELLTSKVPLRDRQGRTVGIVGSGRDVSQLKDAERRLASAERLESMGRLAAGIAHEINTPVQYVGDSVYFIRDAIAELLDGASAPAATGSAPAATGSAPADSAFAQVRTEVAAAVERAIEGLERITEIVRSMKDFSYPDQTETSGFDLNRAVQSTLVVARNTYKYVADVATHLGELPLVSCFGGLINQVILNLVINAADAIADKVKDTGARGLITVRTYLEGNQAVIAVSDSGLGIPHLIRSHIFDPFFTTKEVGRGTGQGLSLCRNIVVKAHGGSLTFDTRVGEGTTFYVRLPLEPSTGTPPAKGLAGG
jgi:two-component system, NtrC family, sensor kinase